MLSLLLAAVTPMSAAPTGPARTTAASPDANAMLTRARRVRVVEQDSVTMNRAASTATRGQQMPVNEEVATMPAASAMIVPA